jgi:hypothetical protein
VGISIGRVGIDIDGLQTPLGYGGYERSGQVLRLQGRMRATTLTDGLWLREQLLGLAGNPDEPWVALRNWTDSQWAEGLYTVEDVQVGSFGLTLTTGGSPYSITLRQAPSFGMPQFETYCTWGGPIPNGFGVTSTGCRLPVPSSTAAIQGFTTPTTTWANLGTSRSASGALGGTIDVPNTTTTTASTVFSGPIAWACQHRDVYDGAASLEVTVGGNFRTLVGRQVPPDLATLWRLTNGVLRITPSGGLLQVSAWDGSSWSTAKGYQVSGTSSVGNVTGFDRFTVLRNSPDEVAIRCWCTTAVGVGLVTMDVAVKRGHSIAHCSVTTQGTNEAWRVARSVTETSSNLQSVAGTNVGVRATSNDAQGDRYLIVSDYGTTLSTASNHVTSATRKTLRFAVGLQVGGSSAASPSTFSELVDDFFSAPNYTTTVRAR